ESAHTKKSMIVDDVTSCDNYISCSLYVKSEIVIPILRNNEVLSVIDIDSHTKAAFTNADQTFLEKVASLIADKAPFVQKQTHL
ncbi:MAG: GAF domain-containing protein, partial [Caldisericia bacterium]|nr:GAF domain-containing protein [Caldisericia bacterium]